MTKTTYDQVKNFENSYVIQNLKLLPKFMKSTWNFPAKRWLLYMRIAYLQEKYCWQCTPIKKWKLCILPYLRSAKIMTVHLPGKAGELFLQFEFSAEFSILYFAPWTPAFTVREDLLSKSKHSFLVNLTELTWPRFEPATYLEPITT